MTNAIGLETVTLTNKTIKIFVPILQNIHQQYYQQLQINIETPFPYWAQVWPSAMALSQFLIDNPHYIAQKNVLELAAGLGLPSLIAAPYAANVTCTDYLPQPLAVVDQSIQYNQFTNMQCSIANWYSLPEDLTADIVLLSDVNYKPEAFDALLVVLQRFLNQGATIILTTPQRLVAKPFVAQLLEWATHHETIWVDETAISLLILGKKQATIL